MGLEYGTEVIDGNGKVLGRIDYVIRDTWTGEIRKFTVRRKGLNKNLSFSPQDVLEVTNTEVKVNFSIDESNEHE